MTSARPRSAKTASLFTCFSFVLLVLRLAERRVTSEGLLANICLDTAESEPSKGWYTGLTFYIYFAWVPYLQPSRARARFPSLLRNLKAERDRVFVDRDPAPSFFCIIFVVFFPQKDDKLCELTSIR